MAGSVSEIGHRTAIVTGAARGLGAALAAELVARGFEVVALVRNGAGAPAASAGSLRYVACDLADLRAVEATLGPLVDACAAAGPGQAVLFNNAATVEPAGVLEGITAADLARSLAVNLAAPTLIAAHFCRAFARVGGDRRIVNVSSGAAASAIPGEGAYCIAKAGLEMLTQVLAAEQAASGMRVVTLRPGVIDTGMQAWLRSRDDASVPSVGMFRDFHARGELVPARMVAQRTVERLVEQPVKNGRTYRYAEL
jgi:NAD(P)-dependent dehydrogenase (short-subunit alcohol dehydrogenase family)